jgi:hypothetical protein
MRQWIALVALLASFAIAHPQEPSGPYIPPPTLAHSFEDDKPLVQAMTSFYGSGDKAAFRATLEKLASSGDVAAQILLAGAYTPPECTFLPFKTAPTDCPNDLKPSNPLGLTPSFELAIHWLTLASNQGNGEATETLAQLIERAIRSSAISGWQMADVDRLHALARSQGFDVQDVEYSCYSLESGRPANTLIMAGNPPSKASLSSEQLDALQAAGVSGTLHWQITSILPNSTGALRHPEGPKVYMRVIVSAAVTREVRVPMPNRADIIYVQQADRVVKLPSTYPTITRSVAFRPPVADEPGGAYSQSIDGNFTAICPSPTSP